MRSLFLIIFPLFVSEYDQFMRILRYMHGLKVIKVSFTDLTNQIYARGSSETERNTLKDNQNHAKFCSVTVVQ